ncbi:MAG: hypothetical protein RIS86_566 [Planctomycetota bacterium]|jgi:hypothetical protein
MTRHALRTIATALVSVVAVVGAESVSFAQDTQPRGRGQAGAQRGGGMRGMMGRGGMGGMGQGMRDMREALQPDFERRDVPLFIRQLSLNDDQSGVLETLFLDYETVFQPEAEAIMTAMTDIGRSMMQSMMTPERQQQMRDTWDSIRKQVEEAEAANGPMDDDQRRQFFREQMQKATERFANEAVDSGLDAEVKDAMNEMLSKLEAWTTRKAELRDDFVFGMKAVLDDDQMTLWPAFDRFLVREKSLSRGRISGEDVNLFFEVDELRLPPDEFAKIEPLFDGYEQRLDEALRARNAYLESSMTDLFRAVRDGKSDGAGRIFKRQADLRSSVRDVNDDYRRQMVEALGDSEWARSLDARVLEKGWQRIFRQTRTDRMFDDAMKIEGLAPETLQAVTDLYSQYRGEIAPVNERLKATARTEEPAELVRNGERFVGMMSQGIAGMARNFGPGGDADREDPMRKLFDSRDAIGERYEERLKALLTPEQYESIAPRGRGRGPGGGGGFGGPGGGFDPNALLERIPEEQRKAFLDRVDANKNGKVDEDEREAVREYMREQFGNFGGGAGGRGGRGGRGGQGTDA